MLDHDRFMNLLFVISLLGFFVVVFNMRIALAAIRRATHYLTPRENTAARAIRDRRKAHHGRKTRDA